MGFLLSTLTLTALLAASTYAAEEPFSYSSQGTWPGICVSGNQNRQSPIDIVPSNVVTSSSLSALEFSSGWTANTNGNFSNTGHNVQFDLASPGSATTENHLGTYLLQQAHMHWGSASDQGSEHRIDGSQHELEIHFVHLKEGATDPTARDYISVIGVFAEVDDQAAISGPWAELNVSKVQPYGASISIQNFVLSQLLPENREYYYYEGSLTTPLCSETVAWFVMKNTIRVPGAYLEQLRQVQEDNNGTLIDFNFRMAQSLGSRTVMTAGSEAVVKPFASLVVVFSVFLIKLLC